LNTTAPGSIHRKSIAVRPPRARFPSVFCLPLCGVCSIKYTFSDTSCLQHRVEGGDTTTSQHRVASPRYVVHVFGEPNSDDDPSCSQQGVPRRCVHGHIAVAGKHTAAQCSQQCTARAPATEGVRS